MSAEIDASIRDLVENLIPVVKKRILRALDRSREDVEFELVTLASLFTIEDGLRRRTVH
jgi:hypothetical protein